jgi:hypothetical protein
VADFRLKVVADTQTAERGLKQVGEVADKATKTRNLDIKVPNLFEVSKTFQTLERDVKSAANTIKTFYTVGKALPGSFGEVVRTIENVGKNATKSAIAINNNNSAAEIFSNTIKGATDAASQLVTTLAKVGFATFAIKETVGILQAAFNGFFNNTIGREIKLRETILKTQTTLASTNKVFKDGKEITDPYQKIVTLTGAVQKNIDSIRERSIALAGVTSNDVIEVFGIVASQVGQIGGGLKEAEDLAINFAAALGTFGIPLYQARQEIGSILRGDITTDSYLAKALGITNEDITKAKNETGGVVKFLEDRLAEAVAGQKIAAQGFSGVMSNIRDLGELIGQNFGRGMLAPLLNGLTAVFETLFRIRKQIFDIASKAGETIGRVGTLVVGLTAGRTGVGKGVDASAAASAASGLADKAFTEIESVAQRTVGAIATVIASLKPTVLILADAFRNVSEAFVQIKVGTFEALASALANVARAAGVIAPIFASIFNLYARLLNTPIVKYFTEVATVLAFLKRAGLDAATSLLMFGKFVISSVIPALGVFGTAAGAVVAGIAAIGLAIGKLVLVLAGLASALVTPAAAFPAVAAAFHALSASLTNVGNQAVGANTKLAGFGKGLTTLGATAKAAGGAILSSLGWIFAFQVGIAVVIDAVGRFQRAQEEQKASARATEALRRLQTTYKNVGDSANSATKSARDFEQAIVNARYDNIVNEVEKIREQIKEVDDYLNDNSLLGRILKSPGRTAIIEIQNKRKEQATTLEKEASEISAQRDRKLAAENVKLETQKRIDLTKEIAELERSHASKLFELRQQAAAKEVEIFRLAGEQRIAEVERANAKMLKGQEGASAAAIDALNRYLATRERGELEIEAAKQELHIESANLDKSVADYRVAIEKQIAEIKRKSNENDIATADYRKQQLLAGGATGAAGSGDSIQAAVAATKNLTGVNEQCAEAVKRFMAVIGVNSSVMTKAAKSAEKMGTVMTDWSKLQPGDIVARGSKGDPSHVGVFTGGQNVFHQSSGRGLTAGNYPDLGYFKEKGYFIRPSGMAAGAGPVAKPVLQEASKLRDPKQMSNEVAAITGSIKNLNAQTAELRAQATNANTKAAFDAIFDGLFPQVPIEGAQNDLIERFNKINSLLLSTGANTAASTAEQKFADIKAETQTQVEILKREVAQVKTEFEKRRTSTDPRNKLSDQQANELKTRADKGLQEQIEKLNEIAKVKKAISAADNYGEALTQQQQLLIQFNQQTEAIKDEAEARRTANRLRMEGFSEEAIQNELRKLKLDQEFQKAAEQMDAQYLLLQNSLAQYNLEQAKGTVLTGAAKEAYEGLNKSLEDLKKRRDELESKKDKAKTDGDAATAGTKQTPREKIGGRISEVKKELAELTNGANIAIKAADGIGNAFGRAFRGLIDQSMTAREALSVFFKDVANMFLEMAAQIIAKQMTMIILQTILKALGAVSGAGSGGDLGKVNMADVSKYSAPLGYAKGGVFGDGVSKFAAGGIVSSPTLFKFANGGTTQTGLMGEAGPEAIMPLSRGPGGKLGVNASGLREAMGSAPGTGGSPILNMSFESTTINGVEYVSRDQLEAAMAQTRRQASADGAKRGMSMTLDRLQQSPQTRSRVGLR